MSELRKAAMVINFPKSRIAGGSEKKVIGKLLRELNDELEIKKTKLELNFLEVIKEFIIETGIFVEEILLNDEEDDDSITLKVEVILEEL